MAGDAFDIYQTEDGYVAVTNEVRRQILQELAKRERGLPELMKLTKKAKPTLSSVHMRDLLERKLVEEIPHPDDKRKKIYRLRARRIGSSSVPVDQLRSAIKHYVSLSPLAARLPLTVSLDAIAHAPRDADDAVLRAQARRLGELASSLFPETAARDLVTALASFLEREGLARPLRLDLERLELEIELAAGLASEAPEGRLAVVLAGFVEGVLASRGHEGASVDEETVARRRVALRLRGA